MHLEGKLLRVTAVPGLGGSTTLWEPGSASSHTGHYNTSPCPPHQRPFTHLAHAFSLQRATGWTLKPKPTLDTGTVVRETGTPGTCGPAIVGVALSGPDLAWHANIITFQACCQKCSENAECAGFTLFTADRVCYLRRAGSWFMQGDMQAVSGTVPRGTT